MSQLPRLRSTLCRALKPGLLESSSFQVRWRTDALEGLSEEKAEKQIGFFEAADVLSKPPVKPKRLGFDFNLWMFIVALTPSAIIFVSAQLIRRMIRKEEKQLQEKEKAELKAKLDALQSEDAETFPRIAQSRGQRHANERAERKLARAQQYLDEKEVAALKEAQERNIAVQGGQRTAAVFENIEKLGEKSQQAGVERLKEFDRGKPSMVQKESKESPPDAEVQRLKAKVAELERGLKSLEESLQTSRREHTQKSVRDMVERHSGRGHKDSASPSKEPTPQDSPQAKSKSEDTSLSAAKPGVSDSMGGSLLGYLWPHWLQRQDEAKQVQATEKTSSVESKPQKPP